MQKLAKRNYKTILKVIIQSPAITRGRRVCMKNLTPVTPGINPTTLDGLSLEVIDNIIWKLRTGHFQFSPGRRIHIPKANGKQRPITIGNPRDKLVLEVMRMVLEAIYEPTFKNTSHGFRPKRGCHSALREINTQFVGCTWWIEGDIKTCFDSIPHSKLVETISRRIKDPRFIELLWKALNAGYMYQNEWSTDIVGVPQGSIISPILANIYLHQLDVFVEELKNEFDSKRTNYHPRTTESINIKYKLEQAKKKIEGPVQRRKVVRKLDTLLRNTPNKKVGPHSNKLMYIRYADDWIVAVNESRQFAKAILEKIRIFCSEVLGLEVSEEKTKITNSYLDKIQFLGTYIRHAKIYLYTRGTNGVKKRVRRGLLLTAPMNRIKNKLRDVGFVKNNKPRTRLSWIPMTPKQIVSMGNQVLRGYWNYYSFVQNRGPFVSYTHWVIREVVALTLAQKLRLRTRAQAYKKFGSRLTITDLTSRGKNKEPSKTSLVEPSYRNNSWDFKVNKDVNTKIPALYAQHVSLANLENLSCVVCDSIYRVEMHHIRKMKDLKPKKNSLDYLMAKANRKQVPLCRNCHMKYHAGKLKITKFIETRDELQS